MDNIFLSVIHLVKTENGDDGVFQSKLAQLKEDMSGVDTDGMHASVSIVAETGLFSCEVAIFVKCGDKSVMHKLDQIAGHYRGTFLLDDGLRIRA